MGKKISKWVLEDFGWGTIYGVLAGIILFGYHAAALIGAIFVVARDNWTINYILLIVALPSIAAFYLLTCRHSEIILKEARN